MKRFNRRGLVEDLADFLFTVFVVIFLFMFISLALKESVDGNNSETLRILVREKAISGVIQENQFNLALGGDVDLARVSEQIEQKKLDSIGFDQGTLDKMAGRR